MKLPKENFMYLDGIRKDIVAWVEQGLNDREIAERCRVSRSTVRYWRERNGVVTPSKNVVLADPQKQMRRAKRVQETAK
jgi:transposase